MEQWFVEIGRWLDALGLWAYILAPTVMAVVALLPIPAEPPAMINGMLFGPVIGGLITWIGAMLGAQLSFELARRLGRPAVERILRENSLARTDRFVEQAGWGGLLLVRFIPLIAFTALNWGAGLTRVSRWRFFWTTAVGILPGALLFSASGYGIRAFDDRLPYLAALAAGLLIMLLALRMLRRRNSPLPDIPARGRAGADS
ncbi:MAG: TVP38/TMEM64 family protein [Gemmatimonadota bacterium]